MQLWGKTIKLIGDFLLVLKKSGDHTNQKHECGTHAGDCTNQKHGCGTQVIAPIKSMDVEHR